MKCPNFFGYYDFMVKLPMPDHMLKKNGGYYIDKKHILVDVCIVDEIQYLWSKGIHTFHSCCGHGKIEPNVLVRESDTDKMLKLGYVEDKTLFEEVPEHKGVSRKWILKSKHRKEVK